MKHLAKIAALLFLVFFSTSVKAQSDERNKIEMVITHEGKKITAELASVGMGITRYKDYPAVAAETALPKDKTLTQGSYYLSLSLKKMNNDLLKLMSKKQTVFSGTITITDTYGKNPPRELKFTNASLESYSDQFSTASYDDVYSSAAISLSTQNITINGILIE